MPTPLLVLEYANMFCGASPQDEGFSNHLVLSQVELPKLEIQYADHRAGGAPVSVEIDMIQTRMECRFELMGMSRQVMELLGRRAVGSTTFFVYGHVRDWHSGEHIQCEAIIGGQLGQAEPTPFARGGTPLHVRYAIRGIFSYTLNLGREPIYDWNFRTNVWAVGGFDQNGGATAVPSDMAFNIPL